jgi:uncharacterized SAM-binding protein YcdF (DUF218 family)
MLKNENIICISSIDWDFIWQGHQEIMSTLAANGNRILFIENTGVRTPRIKDMPRIKQRIANWLKGIKGIRQESENLYIYSPLVLPFPYSTLARFINRNLVFPVLERWMRIVDFNNPIVWTFLPTPLSLDIIESFKRKALVYYCIDSFTVSSASAKKIKKSEIALLERSDLVFVTSSLLRDYCSRYNSNVYKFPFAVNFYKFEKIRMADDAAINELEGISRPIIGYVGGIHRWIDQNLLKQVAQELQDCSFVFIGPLQTKISPLAHIKNIYFLGKQEHDKLPLFIKNFDVCIIPYSLTDYTNNVYPTKLNEYHAMGKAVVSTDLPEVREYNSEFGNLVFIGRSSAEFAQRIREALEKHDQDAQQKRISVARKNSWLARIEKMSDILVKQIEQNSRTTLDWKASLLRIYKTTQRRFIKVCANILIIYMLIFYTPIVWFIAKPLYTRDIPGKADAVVVFAGGVGESGRPGESYQERVQEAVNLYKQGYAKHIIFSSGFTYAFQEVLVMKALAISLGVPDSVILLEDKAKNTYENVVFVKEILQNHKWDKVLLVSSPYHMRRALLVFYKNAKAIEVMSIPISGSLFYSHGIGQDGASTLRQLNLRQLNAILHEYLAILYYYFKGYI